MKIHYLFVAIVLSLFCLPAHADATELGDAALYQAMADLDCDVTLMCVAAHPDDEDGATLAYYRRKFGAHTIAVIATRGEGGQNEIGSELYNDLGVIRTREMMRASKITGAELHFLNLPEFGFSKSPEEAFAVWGREETVRRMVRVIRQTKPNIIITNHGTQKDHGHHQAVGIALQEAFDAAGDPERFPELKDEGLQPWKPGLLYFRAWQPMSGTINIPIDELHPVIGKTYAQIAADALGEHKSQGMGFFIDFYRDGKVKPAYTLIKEKAYEPGDIEAGWIGFKSNGDIGQPVMWPATGLAPRNILEALSNMPAAELAERPVFRNRSFRLPAVSYGMQLSADLADETLVRGQLVSVLAKFSDFQEREASAVTFSIEPSPWFAATPPAPVTVDLIQQRIASTALTFPVPDTAPLTVPEGEHLFDDHFMEPQFTVVARATVKDAPIPVELRMPCIVNVAPRVTVKVVNSPVLVRRGGELKSAFDVAVTNHATEESSGTLLLSMAPGFVLDATSFEFKLAKEGDQRIFTAHATIGDNLEPRDYILNAVIAGDERPSFGVAKLVDVALPENVRVGVVQSYDNTFVNVLEKLNIPHEAITREDFSVEKLDTFSSIIVDIRAYLVRPDLTANNQAFLDYVARDGTLLVMYQKTEEWRTEFAPYPIKLSRNRVTREDAPITVLAPEHALFTTPNAIGETDWQDWLQERGLYFPAEWDAAYTPLIACNDPDETIPPGSLLIAKHGEGNYVYCALSLYRQVREQHPGALRLFANLLAL